MYPFPGSDVAAWLKACSVAGDDRSAAWVIDTAARHKTLLPSHLDYAVAEKRGAGVASLLVAAGVVSPSAVFCVATEAAVAVVASTQPAWDTVDTLGNTPLHTAAMRDIGAGTYAALAAHTSRDTMNSCNNANQTPLMVAMTCNSLGPATALLQAGVDVTSIGLAATAAMASLLVAHDCVPTAPDFVILRARRARRVVKTGRTHLPDALDKKAVVAHHAKQREGRAAKKANLDAIESVFTSAAATHAALIACLEEYD
jgi:hypothetical protein